MTLEAEPSEVRLPFKVTEVKVRNGNHIEYKLQERKTSSGLIYQLSVENLKVEPGRYYDTIYLKTNHQLKPELKIKVFGNIWSVKGEKKKS